MQASSKSFLIIAVVVGGVIVAGVGIFVVAVGFFLWQRAPIVGVIPPAAVAPPAAGSTYMSRYAFYVNDATGAESKQLATEVPPIADMEGRPNLVREVKIKCDGKVKVAYYLKYAPEAHDKLVELTNQPLTGTDEADRRLQATIRENARMQLIRAGEMVRLPAAASPWVYSYSPEGAKIKEDALCPNDVSIEVYP